MAPAKVYVTNGKTDTLCFFMYVSLSLCLSFKAELALFVAIFQFVGTEGRPFMFGRMTTDLGDKSRFPPFLYLQVRRARIAVPDHSNIAPISRFPDSLEESLETKLAYQKKCVWHQRSKIIWTNALSLQKRRRSVKGSQICWILFALIPEFPSNLRNCPLFRAGK